MIFTFPEDARWNAERQAVVLSRFLLEFIQRGLRLNARSTALTEFPAAGVS